VASIITSLRALPFLRVSLRSGRVLPAAARLARCCIKRSAVRASFASNGAACLPASAAKEAETVAATATVDDVPAAALAVVLAHLQGGSPSKALLRGAAADMERSRYPQHADVPRRLRNAVRCAMGRAAYARVAAQLACVNKESRDAVSRRRGHAAAAKKRLIAREQAYRMQYIVYILDNTKLTVHNLRAPPLRSRPHAPPRARCAAAWASRRPWRAVSRWRVRAQRCARCTPSRLRWTRLRDDWTRRRAQPSLPHTNRTHMHGRDE
jgi:hypothetical protein